ncbi:MAG: hypothetical protein IPK50_05030 [Fibrobacterota bacterium]|nr:MAG: hypothetical protein IPK50_05030 [Fibrobacterota bacterium]
MNDAPEPLPTETEPGDSPSSLPFEVRYRLQPALTVTALVLAMFLLGIGVMPIEMAPENVWSLVVLRAVAIPFGLFAAYAGLYAGLFRQERVRVSEEGVLEIGLFGNRRIPWKDLTGFQVEEFQTRSHRERPSSMGRSRWQRLTTYKSWMLSLRSRSSGAQIHATGIWWLATSYPTLDIDLGRLTPQEADQLVRVVGIGHARFPPLPGIVPSARPEGRAPQAAKGRWMLGSIVRALIQAVLLGLPLGGRGSGVLFLIVSVVGTLLTSYRLLEAFEFRAPRWTLAWLALVALLQQGAARWIQTAARDNSLNSDDLPLAITTLVLCLGVSWAMGWIYRQDRPQR